jgi:ubiquitin-conjugating enzyme E2 G1
MTAVSGAASLLKRQLKDIQTSKDLQGVSCGLADGSNLFEWEVMLMISDDCKYYGGKQHGAPHWSPCPFVYSTSALEADPPILLPGGNFRARLVFPPTYPHMPPSLTFHDPVPFHPNIYDHGELCISILHPPEEDQYGYESAAERWSPVQSPETILVSTISLFHDPNDESPANVEAARLFREEKEGKHKDFRRRCRKCVRESLGED